MQTWHLGTWLNGHDGLRLTVGLDDLSSFPTETMLCTVAAYTKSSLPGPSSEAFCLT